LISSLVKASGDVALFTLSTLSYQRTLRAEEDGGDGSSAGARRKSSRALTSGPVRVCRFSYDGKLVAIGYDCGNVEVSLSGYLAAKERKGL